MGRIRIILHGKAAADGRVRSAVQTLRQGGHLVEVRVTWEAGDAARFTTRAIAAAATGKIDCIVAGGGDGTINEVFAAAYVAGVPAGCCLGVLPLGTANDFAHSMGIPVQDMTAALKLAASAPLQWIDIGLLNGKPFINLVSGGFGSRVTVETDPELKRRLGGLAYALTGIARFAELSANRGSIRAEAFAWEGRFVALAVGNGRQAGGGVPLCPDALIDDGLLDLMILPELQPAADDENGYDIVLHVLLFRLFRDDTRMAPGTERCRLFRSRSEATPTQADVTANGVHDPQRSFAARLRCNSTGSRQRAVKRAPRSIEAVA